MNTAQRRMLPDQLVSTHCPYCALNCGLQLRVADSRIQEMVRWKGSPFTGGALCSKGVTAHEQVHHPDRLTRPLIRRGRDFVETSWEEALGRAAEGFLSIAANHGPAANAVLSGGSLTNEKAYLIGKLARLAFATPHVDYNGRFCMSSAAAANSMAFGADRMMTPLDELDNAEVVVVVGANVSAAFPVVLPKLLDGVRKRGGRVIVIDPRPSRFVRDGDLVIKLRPGTDAMLCNGLLQQVIEAGLVDDAFVAKRTTGFELAARSANRYSLADVASEVDVPAELITEAARLIGSTKRCMYLHGRGPEQQVTGVHNVLSLINLGLACGHVGGPGCGINMLTGQRNGQGAREWGQRCNQLPAGRSITDDEHRVVVAERWGVPPETLPSEGKTYVEILQMAERREIRGLLTICTNMSVSSPDLHAVEEQMTALEHCVVIDPFFSASARHADVVLPGSTFAEEEGTITTLEGRVVRIDQAVPPVAGLADLDIIGGLAARLGSGEHFQFSTGAEVFEEMRQVSAGGPVDYAGITYDRLREGDGIFWPCPTPDHPGTRQLYTERFHHPDGLARFHPIAPPSPAGYGRRSPQLVLTTGRVLAQFLSGNQTMRIPDQNAKAPEPVVEIHPDTAKEHDLEAGGTVTITSAIASSEVRWEPNPDLRPDTLFLPYHWPVCNRLIAADLDPISKIPGFKRTPVTIAASAVTPAPSEVPQASVVVGPSPAR